MRVGQIILSVTVLAIPPEYDLIRQAYDLISGHEQVQVRQRQILLFTTAHCSECQRWHRLEQPRMERAGWQFNSQGHIRVIDAQRSHMLAEAYNIQAVPAYVLLREGQPIQTVTGYRTAEQINKLYRGIR